ncbi:MAG: Flp pilus assembly complex ATPase component TadA, partial [Deltaproteobacteria bacterium]|nr:Flp pilus assembly complex ATPase component TadA [Deltaproteobacteria bacterium]
MALRKKIGEILREKGFISEDALKEALILSKGEGIRTGQACIRLGFIDGDKLACALAQQYGLTVVDLKKSMVDEKTLELIPAELLYRARVMPVVKDGETLLATADPTDIITLDDVERLVKTRGGDIKGVAVASSDSIERLLNRGTGTRRMFKEATEGFNLEALRVSEEEEEKEGVLSLEKITQDSSPVVKLVDTTIYDALSKRASDIHLESTVDGLIVKYRLDGVLHKVAGPVDRKFQPSVISRIKVMSELDISERRVPQDGRFKIKIRDKAIDFRVSIMPSIYGEDAVIRILDKEHITKEFQQLRLDLLGFSEDVVRHLRRMIREPYGMILVTGPTGSGKTTTLYAAVSEINTGEEKIVTIEDPVEYELKGVVQIPVNEKKGLTFARGLRSILRHDPDKIMVGEIRDPETAQIAIQAALTGHLVFTTVHANNVFDVIGRFIHMGIEPYNFVSSLNCVIAQRLIRMICPACRKEAGIGREELAASGLDPGKHGGTAFYKGTGCPECYNTGYRARKAIAELLDLSDEIRDMIAAREPLSAIKTRAIQDGMVTLRTVAVECVLRGETTLEEINR